MEPVLTVALPVFAIIAAGYLSGRGGLFGPAASQVLNDFVYYITFPAMIFLSMAEAPVAESLNPRLLAAFFGGVSGVAAVVWILAAVRALGGRPVRPAEEVVRALNAMFANTGYLGVPLVAIAYGAEGLRPALVLAVYNAALLTALGIFLIELDRQRHGGWRAMVGDVAASLWRNPLLLAALAGLAWSASGLALPAAMVNLAELLGAAAPPAALFAIGLFMVGKSLTHGWPETLWLSALKLLLQPAITAALAFGPLALDPLTASVAVLCAALPTGSLVFVIAARYDILVARATAIIVVSTLLSVITLSALLSALAPAG